MPYVPTWQLFGGIAAETTWGTAVDLTTFYPITKPDFTVKYASILDVGYRNNASKDFAYYQATGQSEVDLGEMLFWPDDSGMLLFAVMGVDTVTGSASPYTHTITLLNTGYPSSFTCGKWYDLATTMDEVAGTYFNEVDLKFTNPGSFTIQAKGTGTIMTQATKATPSYSTAPIIMPWQAALTLDGSANTKLIDFEMNLKRGVEMIFGMADSQSPNGGNVDTLEVTGKMTFAAQDLTELNYYLNNTQPATSILMTAANSDTLTIQMTETAFEDPTTIDHGSPYAKTTVSYRGIANSTDGGTGVAPVRFVLVNGRSTAYGS